MRPALRVSLFAVAAGIAAFVALDRQEPAVAQDRVSEGLQDLREGAESLLEGGRKLTEEAVDRAGPALRRAGEVAEDIGETALQWGREARENFEEAIADLEERIDESDADEEVESQPDAVLSSADDLNADTRAAARAVPAGVGPRYVGVWAADASACKLIDQEPVENFAVVTPTTIRRHENVCNFETVAMENDTATIAASCIAEGDEEVRDITFTMPSDGVLHIGTPDDPDMTELVRCRLPGQD